MARLIQIEKPLTFDEPGGEGLVNGEHLAVGEFRDVERHHAQAHPSRYAREHSAHDHRLHRGADASHRRHEHGREEPEDVDEREAALAAGDENGRFTVRLSDN